MARDPIPTWWFALVVVRRGEQFLVVQERKHDQCWYLPAGRVEPGEDLMAAAVRETLEESGIPVILEGVLRLEHTPHAQGTARCRIIFIARPADDTPPKQVPDEESLGAAWVTLTELDQLRLRSSMVRTLFHEVACGAKVYPLDFLVREGSWY